MSCSPQGIPRENPSSPENRPNLRLGSQDMESHICRGYYCPTPYICEFQAYYPLALVVCAIEIHTPVSLVGLEMPVKLGIDPFNIFVVHSVPSYLASSYFVPSSR